jgi:hypothetical protein
MSMNVTTFQKTGWTEEKVSRQTQTTIGTKLLNF